MQKISEDCPIKDILKQVESVLALLDKILEHCKNCLKGKEE